jgi:hypothetical protein
MRKTSLIIAALGLLAAGISPALADQMPPGMNDMPAQKKQAKPKPKPTHPTGHPQPSALGPDAHKMVPQPSPSPSPTPSPSPPAMPMKSGGCC